MFLLCHIFLIKIIKLYVNMEKFRCHFGKLHQTRKKTSYCVIGNSLKEDVNIFVFCPLKYFY